MKKQKTRFHIHARDIIALIVIICLFICKWAGFNGMIDTAIALVVGYYFSKRIYEESERGKNKK